MEILVLATVRAAQYVLISLGFALVFGSCRVLNLMHGTYVMLGAYATYGVVSLMGADTSVGLTLSVALAGIATSLLGWSFFKLLQITGRTRPQHVLAISVAANLFVAQLIQYRFGTEGLSVPSILSGAVTIAGVTVPWQDLLNPPLALIAFGLLWLWLHRSKAGMALRAVADDPDAARLVGVQSGKVLAGAVGIAALLAGLAGGIIGPSEPLAPDMWVRPLLVSFAVVVLGGRGSLAGAALSACVLGFAETLASWAWSEAAAQYVALVMIMIGLVLFPTGLSGGVRYDAR